MTALDQFFRELPAMMHRIVLGEHILQIDTTHPTHDRHDHHTNHTPPIPPPGHLRALHGFARPAAAGCGLLRQMDEKS
jgi:hypothetical protein